MLAGIIPADMWRSPAEIDVCTGDRALRWRPTRSRQDLVQLELRDESSVVVSVIGREYQSTVDSQNT